MRILLDHCVKKQLAQHFGNYEVRTTYSLGWQDLSNGQLLKQADAAGFYVLITVDKNMPFQSSLKGLKLAVAVLDSPSNSLSDLIAYANLFMSQIDNIRSGEFCWIRGERA